MLTVESPNFELAKVMLIMMMQYKGGKGPKLKPIKVDRNLISIQLGQTWNFVPLSPIFNLQSMHWFIGVLGFMPLKRKKSNTNFQSHI